MKYNSFTEKYDAINMDLKSENANIFPVNIENVSFSLDKDILSLESDLTIYASFQYTKSSKISVAMLPYKFSLVYPHQRTSIS